MKFHRIVVLIDADNTNLANLEKLIQYISTRGRIVVKRAYGNWSENLKDKKSALQQSGFKTEHYFNCVPGKNATDIALAIDAVDLLHKILTTPLLLFQVIVILHLFLSTLKNQEFM